MNYLKQLLAFYDKLELNPLNSSEIALWHALMSINNKTAWSDTFTVASSVLRQRSGLGTTNFFKTRNALNQKGYIKWSSSGANKAAKYQIKVLYNSLPTDSVDNSVDTSRDSHVDTSRVLTKQKSKVNKTNKDSHDSKPAKRVYDPDDINLKLANYLLTKIRERNSSIYPIDSKNPPDTQKWANDIRLMHERDARSYDDIKRIIEWCQQDSFWQNNILSASKLRKQFGKLIDKADAPNNFNGNKGGRKPLYDLPY